MADFHVPDQLIIQSHAGPYRVVFDERLLDDPGRAVPPESHVLVDANVARLYAKPLSGILSDNRTIVIEATEENKSIERIVNVIHRLVDNKIRRHQVLVGIGGGIVQDITCFIASTLLRGLDWRFVPTTLLAQADSCIGSKSSVNLGSLKNILGTFNPPREIHLCTGFLDTLEEKDIRSGLGEIIKVHAIDSACAYDTLAADFNRLRTDRVLLQEYINKALRIKQHFIEADEFDRGIRNVFNYGHSFGHAIESATDFAVPHGVAVTMGMAIANHVSLLRGTLPESHYQRMRPMLVSNCAAFAQTPVSVDSLLAALAKDKKNTTEKLVVILPIGDDAEITRVEISNDGIFRQQCEAALTVLRS
jgi:3-dehydroquinate synthase